MNNQQLNKMKTSTFFKKYQVVLCLLLSVIIFSCKKSDVVTPAASIPAVDVTLLTQLKLSQTEFDKNQIWDGYHFSTYPLYVGYINKSYTEVNSTVKPLRGYIINPDANISATLKVKTAGVSGLNAYRYDDELNKLQANLATGNGIYNLTYQIAGKPYVAFLYTDKKSVEVPAMPLLGYTQTIAHEVFHVFQNENWATPVNAIQDADNYPLNKDLVSLQLLTYAIAKKLPAETNKATVLSYLKMYVAIRSKELELDPTANKLVKNMANEQEKLEGTARYIEFSIAAKVVTGYNENSFVFAIEQSTSGLTNKADFRDIFTSTIWYLTGASATYMLKNQGVNIEAGLKANITLYDIAKTYLNLSTQDMATALQSAKDQFNWTATQAEAQRLTNLN